MFKNVKIRVTHAESGVNVECDMHDDISPAEIKAAIKSLLDAGFTRTSSGGNTSGKADMNGKTGSVISITQVEGKKQWKIGVTLHEVGAGQTVFTTFSEKYRIGDRVRLSVNDKGFLDGTIINDESLEGEKQKPLQ